jgi:hypothetical protein
MENTRIHVSAKQLIGAILACASLAVLIGLGAVRAEAASSRGCASKHAKPISPRRDGRISGNYKHGSILITRRKVRSRDSAGRLFVTDAYYACVRSRHRAFLVEKNLMVDSGEIFINAWAIHAPYIAYVLEVDGPDYANTDLYLMNVLTGDKLHIDSSDGTDPANPADQGATYTITESGISDCGAITYEKNGYSKTSQGFCPPV